MSIAIVGAGSWGVALANIFSFNGLPVLVVDHNAQRAAERQSTRTCVFDGATVKLNPSVTVCDYEGLRAHNIEQIVVALFAVPSVGFAEAFSKFTKIPEASTVPYIVHAIKGIIPNTLEYISSYIQRNAGHLRVGVLSGPNLASEIFESKPSAAVIGTRYDELADYLTQCLSQHKFFKLTRHSDVRSIEVCGVLKNLYAFMGGMISSLNLGNNFQAIMLLRCIQELEYFLEHIVGDGSPAYGLAGLSDLQASFSQKSRNFRAGFQLFEGALTKLSAEQTTEAVSVLRALHTNAKTSGSARLTDTLAGLVSPSGSPQLHDKKYFDLLIEVMGPIFQASAVNGQVLDAAREHLKTGLLARL